MSDQVGDMIAQIATAATEQSAATEQVNANVAQISSSTQESAAAAEQAAKACSELSNLSLDLQKVVSQFKLDTSNQPSYQSAVERHAGRAAAAGAGH